MNKPAFTGTSDLQQSVLELARGKVGRFGVHAQTLDGESELRLGADEIFPSASSIKLLVLFCLLARADRGEIRLAERVELDAAAQQPGSGVLFHLQPGLRPTLRDLATLMMMISDNSALMLLSRFLGPEAINHEIRRAGMEKTRFGDWSRFHSEYADSMTFGSGTPAEFSNLLHRLWLGELLQPASITLFWDIMRIQKYILPLRRHLPVSPWSREFGFAESVWVASKGGLLDDCACESGLVRVHDGGWVVSIMIADTPGIAKNPELGENLISDISLAIYQAWAPWYPE